MGRFAQEIFVYKIMEQDFLRILARRYVKGDIMFALSILCEREENQDIFSLAECCQLVCLLTFPSCGLVWLVWRLSPSSFTAIYIVDR